jgi:hypothetical protein
VTSATAAVACRNADRAQGLARTEIRRGDEPLDDFTSSSPLVHSWLHHPDRPTKAGPQPEVGGVDASIPGPIADSSIVETGFGAFAQEDLRFTRWLRMLVGARVDRLDASVSNESQTAVDRVSGDVGQALLSPKGTVIVSPWSRLDLFGNFGNGFHSNDARTLLVGQATTLMARATGAEIGATFRPLEGLSLNAVGYLLDVTSEQTIDGDTASTSPSGPTRRYGVKITGRYDLDERVFADLAFTASHTRYTDQADIQSGEAYVPLAPVRTFGAGVGAHQPVGPVTLVGAVHVRSMSDRYATPDGALIATLYTLVDAELGGRWKNVEVAADVLNIGDVAWREGQFAVQSRLPQEGPNPPTGISFTPGIPRTVLVHGALYW